MSKFAGDATASAAPGPVTTIPGPSTTTHEHAPAHELDAKGQLFTLAITSFVEPKFYEKSSTRLVNLVHEVAKTDPRWVADLAKFTRQTMNMRSVSVVIACELVKTNTINFGREVINDVCVRADEPAEVLGYWMTKHGRQLPMAIKRGVADAVKRLYTQRNALKYDAGNSNVRMADVIELVHPKPKDEVQSALFCWLIDRRHNRPEGSRHFVGLDEIDSLAIWVKNGSPLDSIPDAITWERLSTYHKMDAAAWEAVIPKMGLMALTRNLRNFDKAQISDEVALDISRKFYDADEVKRSRQLPFRFYTAFREQQTMTYGPALEKALQLSCVNVPAFGGRTMVLVDVSGSMTHTLSERSTVQLWEVGGVFAAVMAKRCDRVNLIPFATGSMKTEVPGGNKDSLVVMNALREIVASQRLAHGTNIFQAIQEWYDGEDRIVIFSDLQTRDYVPNDALPNVNIYSFDLAGYGRTGIDLSRPGRYQLGGFSDACFKMMELIEQGRKAQWPWEEVGNRADR